MSWRCSPHWAIGGFKTDAATALRWTLGIGTPVLAAVFWGLFLSPKASVPLNGGLKLALELAVFGAASAALHAAGRPASAVALLGVWAVNRILIAVLGPAAMNLK
ncbi:YrdB family protein [Cohnella rhizosphaerae]|uniref:YrdB family protein n=1 Tax=Cohnella rhizosphaerae TaxID=1457232 RepID=A0A9X4KUP3_9BACL|nr:YrdB family protein [Cohnella rhizosphaerae]MDG0811461.1 YrdB family protein [Cohnella rhizosphaerae]